MSSWFTITRGILGRGEFDYPSGRDLHLWITKGLRWKCILLLTANPNDEVHFFGPVLLGLGRLVEEERVNVAVLPLSKFHACGTTNDVNELQAFKCYTNLLKQSVLRHEIDTIITFGEDRPYYHDNTLSWSMADIVKGAVATLDDRPIPKLYTHKKSPANVILNYVGPLSLPLVRIDSVVDVMLNTLGDYAGRIPVEWLGWEFVYDRWSHEKAGKTSPPPTLVFMPGVWEWLDMTRKLTETSGGRIERTRGWLYFVLSRYAWVNKLVEVTLE
ncbi:N-acetylglucosaminyl-phosphatidylinositol de-N-acetylase [Paramarasmius palmivorus]|uniref:N-acetylglucosaminyl-phosphatidylinositol de-N-acetylase n=1 Tax=Paramarasmius palmivorus TaxID=297713 RepID=A0AAW0BJV6_9AGAR